MEPNGHDSSAQSLLGKFFYVKPELAGGFGSNTVMDSSAQPPVVTQLHFEVNKWLGDDLLEANATFVVTDRLALKIRSEKVSGCSIDKVELSMSEEFRKTYPDTKLPDFLWLKIVGKAGEDDFGMAGEHLVVSEKGLTTLKSWNLEQATVSDFANGIGKKIAPVLPAAPIVPMPLPPGANDQALVVTDMAGQFCKNGEEKPAAAEGEKKEIPPITVKRELSTDGVKRKKTPAPKAASPRLKKSTVKVSSERGRATKKSSAKK